VEQFALRKPSKEGRKKMMIKPRKLVGPFKPQEEKNQLPCQYA
jgi:hypothetical protein